MRIGQWLRPRGWLVAWNRIWFPHSSAVRLAVLRIVLVGFQLWLFHPRLGEQLEFVRANEHLIDPRRLLELLLLVVPVEVFRTPEMMIGLWWVTTVTGLMALVGLITRPALIVFALGNWVMQMHSYSYGDYHHPEALFLMALLLVGLGPCDRVLSLDRWLWGRKRDDWLASPGAGAPLTPPTWGAAARFRTAMWPLVLVQVLLALSYLNAGLCKIGLGGPEWFNGYTLQGYLLQDAIRWDRPWGLWLAKQHELCVALSYMTVLFEVTFCSILVFRRLTPLFLVGGAMMHTAIFITQAAPFWQFIVLYAVFIPFERLPGLRPPPASKRTRRIEAQHTPTPASVGA